MKKIRAKKIRGLTVLVSVAVMALLSAPGLAHADRHRVARITKLSDVGPLRTDLWVYSPSNHKKMKVNVLTPANATGPRSVVYMLDGADAGDDVSDWEGSQRLINQAIEAGRAPGEGVSREGRRPR